MLTQQQLETHLWSCADVLRGSIDSEEFRSHILTLVFYKRLADQSQFEAQTAGRRRATRSQNGPRRIEIPPGCSWQDLSDTPPDRLGRRLDDVMSVVGSANPQLDAVLRSVSWNATVNDDGVQKPRIGGEVLRALVLEFDKHDLSDANVDADVLRRGYEHLIGRFADDSGARGCEFYTPREIVQVLIRILEPAPNATIYDPTCGSGGMLIYGAEHLRRQSGSDGARAMRLFGQERNWSTWAIARMNMLMHGLEAEIRGGASTLTDPQFLTGDGTLQTFDVVIANFPFSDKFWGCDELSDDPFGRFTYGVPPKGNGDFAYLQHIIASMNESGRAGVVCSQGVLYRGRSEGRIRRAILEDDIIEAVIGLPADIFHGNSIPACLLIFNRRKPERRQGRVLFIDASGGYERVRRRNRLRPEDVDRIVEAFESGRDEDRYCRLVAMDEIAAEGFILSVPRYVDTFDPKKSADLAAAMAALDEAETARERAMATLRSRMGELTRVDPTP
jgi:type I restriction enzyme M protein